jgi:glucose dehydrogenase
MRIASPFQSAAPAASTDWSVYNGGVDGDHYSPLTQITPTNVAGLKQVWRVDVGTEGGVQANPLVGACDLWIQSHAAGLGIGRSHWQAALEV